MDLSIFFNLFFLLHGKKKKCPSCLDSLLPRDSNCGNETRRRQVRLAEITFKSRSSVSPDSSMHGFFFFLRSTQNRYCCRRKDSWASADVFCSSLTINIQIFCQICCPLSCGCSNKGFFFKTSFPCNLWPAWECSCTEATCQPQVPMKRQTFWRYSQCVFSACSIWLINSKTTTLKFQDL